MDLRLLEVIQTMQAQLNYLAMREQERQRVDEEAKKPVVEYPKPEPDVEKPDEKEDAVSFDEADDVAESPVPLTKVKTKKKRW